MKKRIISVIMAVVLAFSGLLVTTSLAAGYEISVSDFEAKLNETVTVEVKLENKVENAVNAFFSLDFNPEVLQIVKNGEAYEITHGEVFEDFLMQAAGNNTQGYANFGGTAAEGVTVEKGVIYTVTFKVVKEADPQLKLTVESFAVDKEDTVAQYPSIKESVSVKQATVTVPGGDPGENPGGNPGENPGGDPGENPGGNEGENPGENPGGNEGENQGGNTENKPADKEDAGDLTTGDNLPVILIIALAVISAAAGLIIYKKKQHN